MDEIGRLATLFLYIVVLIICWPIALLALIGED